MTERKYVRVYYSIVNDERFAEVYHDARTLGTWLQLLLVADAMYPADAPLPAYVNRHALRVLTDAGIVELVAHQHYRVHGLASEREMRSASARIANAIRWDSERSPKGVPRRDEHRQDEQRRADDAESDDGRDDLEAYLLVCHRAPTPRQRKLLDDLLDRHDVNGPAWAAQIILEHPDDPIGAVIEADKAWRAERIAAARTAERKPRPVRRGSGLTGINAELAALLRSQEAEATA